MPYKCVHCSEIYEDGSEAILKGCSNCQGKFFFYIKKEKLEEIKKNEEESFDLSKKEKEQVEQDLRDIAGVEDEETPIFLDFESIKIIKPGKYLLDIARLFEKGQPHVYQLENGKYIVDFSVRNKDN